MLIRNHPLIISRILPLLVCGVLLVGVLTADALTVKRKVWPVPDIKRDCTLCHSWSEATGAIELHAPVPELCIMCHAERAKKEGEHAMGLVPKITPVNLPLDAQGKINCLTCHEPHGLPGNAALLRMPDICASCHRK